MLQAEGDLSSNKIDENETVNIWGEDLRSITINNQAEQQEDHHRLSIIITALRKAIQATVKSSCSEDKLDLTFPGLNPDQMDLIKSNLERQLTSLIDEVEKKSLTLLTLHGLDKLLCNKSTEHHGNELTQDHLFQMNPSKLLDVLIKPIKQTRLNQFLVALEEKRTLQTDLLNELCSRRAALQQRYMSLRTTQQLYDLAFEAEQKKRASTTPINNIESAETDKGLDDLISKMVHHQLMLQVPKQPIN